MRSRIEVGAARTVAHYKDPRSVPALKKALAAEKDESYRRYIFEGLIAARGLTEPEQVAGLEAYAAKLTTPNGREDAQRYRSSRDEPLPVPVSIGIYLATLKSVPESLVTAILARAATLKKENPPLAQSLLEVAHQWQGRQIDLNLIQQIGAGAADAGTIVKALDRRAQLRESVEVELQSLMGRDGLAPGVAAALLEDDSLAQSVLSSGTTTAQIALLASARLTKMQLPVETVGALMQSKNQLLAAAAEQYLLVEDSKRAQELLWARHPGEAFITGWRENIQLMSGNNLDAMGKSENKLKAELFKEDGPEEIFALLSNAEGKYSRVLRVYQDRAVYTFYEDPARHRRRTVSNAELAAFKNFVETNNVTDLGPQLRYCHYDCSSRELLTLTKAKGRRVFSQGFSGWDTLLANFDLLGKGEGATTHYALEDQIKGLEVLYDNPNLSVKDVWKRGSDLRILVERGETAEEENEHKQSIQAEEDADEDDAVAREEQRRLKIARLKALISWRAFANGQAGDPMSQPEGYDNFDETRFPLIDGESSHANEGQTQSISVDSVVIARNFEGLWRQAAGQKAVRISGEEGAYANPIVTADGKWVVVAKTDSDWGGPNYIVRFNLQNGREYRVNVPEAEQLDPIPYLAPHGKVLLRRAKDEDVESRNKRRWTKRTGVLPARRCHGSHSIDVRRFRSSEARRPTLPSAHRQSK